MVYISLQLPHMSDAFVNEQVRIIEEATKEAAKSKEAALRFLKDAGIIKKQEALPGAAHPQQTKTTK